MFTPKRIALGFVGIITVTLVFLPTLPLGREINLEENNATIIYGITRRFVFLPTSCATYYWQVDNVQTVRFGADDTVGEAQTTHCDSTDVSILRVGFTDGQVGFYYLQPAVLASSQLAQAVAFLALALLAYAVAPAGINQRVIRVTETVAIWVLVTFVLLEVGFRLWVVTAGTATDRVLYLGTPQEIVDANRDYIDMPFMNYGLSPLRSDVNRAGFRGPEIEIDKPDDVFRIVAMGGSTTYGHQLAVDETWPARLEVILREDYGYENVEVINAGGPGYSSTHSLINFLLRVVELDPDMVFVYHAVNDAGLVMSTSADCYRGNNIALGFGSTPSWDFDAPPFGSSAFLRFMNLRLGLVANPLEQQDLVRTVNNANCDVDGEVDPSSHYYERNLRHLITLIEANDVQPVFSTWAYAYSQRPDEFFEHYAQESLMSTETLNDVMRDFTAELRVPLYDLEAEMEYDPAYWQDDLLHQTAAGTQRQAELYAQFLDDSCLVAPC